MSSHYDYSLPKAEDSVYDLMAILSELKVISEQIYRKFNESDYYYHMLDKGICK